MFLSGSFGKCQCDNSPIEPEMKTKQRVERLFLNMFIWLNVSFQELIHMTTL